MTEQYSKSHVCFQLKYLAQQYSPKPFMAFLRTSTSLSWSAPGKSLIVPLNPLWQYKPYSIIHTAIITIIDVCSVLNKTL